MARESNKLDAAALGLSSAELEDLALVAEESKLGQARLAGKIIRLFLRGENAVIKSANVELRRQAANRLAILRSWWGELRTGAAKGLGEAEITAKYLKRIVLHGGAEISRRTLYGWDHRWRAEGLDGLIDGRRLPRERENGSDEFVAEVKRLFQSRFGRGTFAASYREALTRAKFRGWPTLSEPTARRIIGGVKPARKGR